MILMCSYCQEPCGIYRCDNSNGTGESFEYLSECCLEEIIDLSVAEDPEDYHEEIPSQNRLKTLWKREREDLMKWDDYEGEEE